MQVLAERDDEDEKWLVDSRAFLPPGAESSKRYMIDVRSQATVVQQFILW